MYKKEKIHFVITGGTIDSEWSGARDTAVPASESSIPEYLDSIKLELDMSFKTLFLKDSRELLPDDVKQICQAVDESSADKVVVTHGTYTMPDTARFIEANMKTKKSVILTASMIPLKGYTMSDAGFNLGFAIASLLHMEPGVLLAMHGRLFKPQEVIKNLAQAHFLSIKQ